MAVIVSTPARLKFVAAQCRRSCNRRPVIPALRQAAAKAVLGSSTAFPYTGRLVECLGVARGAIRRRCQIRPGSWKQQRLTILDFQATHYPFVGRAMLTFLSVLSVRQRTYAPATVPLRHPSCAARFAVPVNAFDISRSRDCSSTKLYFLLRAYTSLS